MCCCWLVGWLVESGARCSTYVGRAQVLPVEYYVRLVESERNRELERIRVESALGHVIDLRVDACRVGRSVGWSVGWVGQVSRLALNACSSICLLCSLGSSSREPEAEATSGATRSGGRGSGARARPRNRTRPAERLMKSAPSAECSSEPL